MNAKKIIITAGLLLSATSAALAQSSWTTGTASDMARAGFGSPYGSGIYAYAPVSRHASGLGAYAMVRHTRTGFIHGPSVTGGGSAGYNDLVREQW